MTHFPKNIYCLTCMAAKCPRVQHKKGTYAEEAKKATRFGDLVTCDYIVMRSLISQGHNQEEDSFMLNDSATNFLGGFAVKNLSW